jgi:large subunit ribosomal protein L3
MKSLKAKKVHMTQIFSDAGVVEAVTLLQAPEAISADSIVEGDTVSVTSISKGKGFQGVVKRHGFKGGRRSHGQKHSEREPGSIGGGGRAGGRVMKGMRMAGRMGGDKITVSNLRIVKILPETNEIFVSGAVPGRRGTLVTIKSK